MAKYSAKSVTVPASAQTIADKFADISKFQSAVDQLPADQRSKIGDVEFEKNAIIIKTPQVGNIKLQVVELSTSKISMQAVSSPVPMALVVDMKPLSADSTEVTSAIEVEIPAMLRPMVGGKLQEAANKFGEMIGNLTTKL